MAHGDDATAITDWHGHETEGTKVKYTEKPD